MVARRALVTGGNRGIGLAVARGLRDAGTDVVVAARRGSEAEAVAGELGCDWIALDLDRPDMFESALAEAGEIDILVNNAGVLWDRSLLDEPEDFRRSMQVMVHAPYALIRMLVPDMAERGYGRIVNVSSGWGSFAEGLGGPGAYGVAKAALNALTLAAAREVSSDIKINAVCPGWVRTRMGGPSANLTPEEGAETIIWAATLPDDGPTGKFLRRKREISW